jgi:NADPH-dependent ferric siderophore reductase
MDQVSQQPASEQAAEPLVQRVRHELKRRDLTVARIDPLSPGFVAITLTGESLADFTTLSFDDHVKFLMSDAAGEPVRRDYTPRRFSREARELVIEFALHGEGHASEWARGAVVGQAAAIGGPKGSMILPSTLDWHLLVGDATALPAITRRLEELPAGQRVIVFAHVDEADRRTFAAQADVDVHWFATPDALTAALRAFTPPDGAGFAWGGGEGALMVQVRQLLADKGVPRERTRVSSYWKQGVADHHERLD